MVRKLALWLALILLPTAAFAGDAPEERKEPEKQEEQKKSVETGAEGEKLLSGMSILGNDDAPKSLVIVPWKSSDLGDTLDVLRALEDGRQPVDPDVFLRELTYYEIRAGQSVHPSSGRH